MRHTRHHLHTIGMLALALILGAPTPMTSPTPATARAGTICDTELPPPASTPPLTADQEAAIDQLLSTMPLEVKIGQMLMAGVTGTTADADARAMIDDLHIGNIILMGRNIEHPAQVQHLTSGLQEMAIESNGIAAIIATDQEGGLVQRLHYTDGFTALPMAATVGIAQCPERVRAYGAMAGAEMAAVGVTMDMAPVLDVNSNPDNPVIGALGRSFGATPELVEQAAIPFMLGLHDAGVMSTGKHFPGHGATTTDSHEDLPYVEESRETLEAVDIAPFRTAIAYGIDGIMPAHVVYPALDPDNPATISSAIQTGLLREDLGYDGLIITDDMGMKGITNILPPEESGLAAVQAGADIVLCVRLASDSSCGPDMLAPLRQGLLDAAEDGALSEERIDASVRRVLAAKLRNDVGPVGDADLSEVNGASHLRAVINVLDAVAERKAEEGAP